MSWLVFIGLIIIVLGFLLGTFVFLGVFTCHELQNKADNVAGSLLIVGCSIFIIGVFLL